MTRNESFSIASLSNVAWYAGTFIPIKNTDNLENLLKLNIKTFCMLINDVHNSHLCKTVESSSIDNVECFNFQKIHF